MKRINLTLLALVIFKITSGQANPRKQTLPNLTKLDFGLQGVGFTYEPRLGNKITTDLSLGYGGGYDISESSLDYEAFKPALYFSAAPKYFYNIKRRIVKGKTVHFNSGNYIGVRLKYDMPLDNKTDAIRNSFLTNIHWGLQRPLGEKWLFASHIGLGYAWDTDSGFGLIYPSLDFKFSYVFSGQRK